MAEELLGTFRCVLFSPKAKLLDCKTHSIIVPAHDGQLGVQRNHMPILCSLGIGIMQVRDFITDENSEPTSSMFLIDGGFLRVSNNLVEIIAYDVIADSEADAEKAEKMLAEANKLPADNAQAMQNRRRQIKKATLLTQMIQLSMQNKDGRDAAA